ncbi:hypothetical protein GI374_06855 [Paracoccus sp. S-4012]|uniref:hypothetical protein n=1 Tax=Paracoccus sp. S-4012 TaxID=2665648 RepID=UPI0012AFB7D9|nr:hypothetical protein [Paracoccus sp. S-4012]MRX50171.1 hypothetical protein [Paracoccus sp. S-4012]
MIGKLLRLAAVIALAQIALRQLAHGRFRPVCKRDLGCRVSALRLDLGFRFRLGIFGRGFLRLSFCLAFPLFGRGLIFDLGRFRLFVVAGLPIIEVDRVVGRGLRGLSPALGRGVEIFVHARLPLGH